MAHDRGHNHLASREADHRALAVALGLISAFMVVELVAGIVASSLAILSDAAHMLTDAGALAISLFAARLASRPAKGAMTFGMGRAEILSAQANGVTLLVLGLLIVYEAITRLVSPPKVSGGLVLAVAVAGIAVNLLAARVLSRGSQAKRSLNVEGSYRHILTDLYGFIATAIAAAVILGTGFQRADPIASLIIAGLMLHAAYGLIRASGRVFLEAAPAGLDPQRVGGALAAQAGVVEVHDLHVWEITSGFPALSAHVVVRPGADQCQLRRELEELLAERFHIHHTTLQVDELEAQPPLQIEVAGRPVHPPRAANPPTARE